MTSANERLASGEIQHITQALHALAQQYNEERRWIRRVSAHHNPEEAQQALAAFAGPIAAVEQCMQQYWQAIQPVEQQLFQQWATSDNEEQRRIGAAAWRATTLLAL